MQRNDSAEKPIEMVVEFRNDCVATGNIIIGRLVQPSDKIGTIEIPEKAITKFRNILKITSIGPDVNLQYFVGEKYTDLKVGDFVYCRVHMPIHATIDLAWVEPNQVVGIKLDTVGSIITA